MQRTSLGAVLTCLLLAAPAFGQWLPDQRLTNDPGSSRTAENANTWTVAVKGDTVHVVWTDNRDGNDEIYYKRSTDGGVTWGSDTRLTNATGRSWCPSVAVAGDNVHVVWDDARSGDWYEIYYRRSTDGGVTWLPEVLFPLSPRLGFEPSVAVDGNNVHVVWDGLPSETGGPLEVYYRRSTDAGATWGGVTRLTNDPANCAWQPSVAVAGANVHIAWYDSRNGNGEIYYKRSTDGGSNWGLDTRLTNDSATSAGASIAVAADAVHLVWHDLRDGGTHEIYYKCSTDNGATWPTSPGGDTRLTPADDETSYYPSIAVAGDRVHVVWSDRRDPGVTREVYYKCSTDGGATWGSDQRLTTTGKSRWNSQKVVVAGAGIYVVWSDSRDGNYEVYYKRNPTGNVAVVEPGLRDQCGAFRVAPNPVADGVATVRIQGIKDSRNQVAEVRVFDAAGRCVLTRLFDIRNPSFGLPLDLRGLSSGVYLVRLDAHGSTAMQKLVAQCKHSRN